MPLLTPRSRMARPGQMPLPCHRRTAQNASPGRPIPSYKTAMNGAPKSGFPLWILAIVIPAAMPLLLCGGMLMLVVYWLWEAPATHQPGGPAAIAERDAPPQEMELRPGGPVRVDDIL